MDFFIQNVQLEASKRQQSAEEVLEHEWMQGEIYNSNELEAIMEEKYQTYICDNEELIQKQREKYDQSDIGNKRSFGPYRSVQRGQPSTEEGEETKDQMVNKKLGVY